MKFGVTRERVRQIQNLALRKLRKMIEKLEKEKNENRLNMSNVTAAEIAAAIRNVPDFPKPGIQFKDITPVLADARLFAGSIDLLTQNFAPGSVDAVVGIDARGFIFAAAAATKLKAGFVPVRKKGKLPYADHRAGLRARIRPCNRRDAHGRAQARRARAAD